MINLIRITNYLFKYWKIALIAIFAMAFDVICGFAIPSLVQYVIDDIIPLGSSGLNKLLLYGALMIGIAILGLLLAVVNTFFAQIAAQSSVADLRNDLFTKIQSMSLSNVDNFKTSKLINTTTNDVLQVQQFFQMSLRIIVRAPLLVIVGLYFAINASKELSTVFIVVVPIMVLLLIVIMILALPRFTKVQKDLDTLNGVVHETVSSPRVIKSFVSQGHENDRFTDANQTYYKTNNSAQKIMAYAEPSISAIFNGALGGIVLIGVISVSNGNFISSETGLHQAGVFIAFSTYTSFILFGLMMLMMVLIFISRATVSAKRIVSILDEKVDIVDCEKCLKDFELTGGLSFNNVDFSYTSHGNKVLKNISFNINSGETIGVIGSTGSGKSTLIGLVPRLYDVCSGSVSVETINNGIQDIKTLNLNTLRSQISVVTQKATIFSGSIGTNILQGNNKATIEEVEEAAKNSVSYEFIKDLDHLYNSRVQQKGANLSGGQKQRISLARAFVKKPSILILDDSTSAVDANSEEEILKSIDKFSGNTTTIVISQKISTIRNMDKILVLTNSGEIDGFDTHKELLLKSIVYQEIFKSQYGEGGDLNG